VPGAALYHQQLRLVRIDRSLAVQLEHPHLWVLEPLRVAATS
jgi:hypothetical protein